MKNQVTENQEVIKLTSQEYNQILDVFYTFKSAMDQAFDWNFKRNENGDFVYIPLINNVTEKALDATTFTCKLMAIRFVTWKADSIVKDKMNNIKKSVNNLLEQIADGGGCRDISDIRKMIKTLIDYSIQDFMKNNFEIKGE